MLSRRTLIGALSAGLLGAGLASCARTPRLDIAAGESGGMYFQFATRLAELIERKSIADASRAIATQASAQNLELLASGDAGLCLALADTVAEFRQQHPSSPLAALGRVYQNYFHVIVRADSAIRTTADLDGARLGTGAAGSGTWVTGQRIITLLGADSAEFKLGYAAGAAALEKGQIDALFLFGGMPVATVSDLASRVPLRLVDLGELIAGMQEKYPGLYQRVEIPGDTYPGVEQTATLGVGNLLMCRKDLPDHTARDLVNLLVEQASELIPPHSVGIQFLTAPTLISTAGQPLHPAAREAYRKLHG